MNILGLITARGGSKRVPGKNIKDFLGKPLLVWSIEVGKTSGIFDRFILSSDDSEIIEVGKNVGIDVPFVRPSEFATDTASSFDVVKHAVLWLRDNEGWSSDWIILLEPSSPGRQSFHIQEVKKIIEENKTMDSVVGISQLPAHFHPLKVLEMEKDGMVARADGTILRDLTHRNQDIPPAFYINSAIYAFKTDNLFAPEKPSLWGMRTYGYVMDKKYALDIDTPEDWELAEFKMKKLLNK